MPDWHWPSRRKRRGAGRLWQSAYTDHFRLADGPGIRVLREGKRNRRRGGDDDRFLGHRHAVRTQAGAVIGNRRAGALITRVHRRAGGLVVPDRHHRLSRRREIGAALEHIVGAVLYRASHVDDVVGRRPAIGDAKENQRKQRSRKGELDRRRAPAITSKAYEHFVLLLYSARLMIWVAGIFRMPFELQSWLTFALPDHSMVRPTTCVQPP